MTDDILAGIRTAIDHGAKALGPAIDRMIEWADTLDGRERDTALRQAELLRWMMGNVERVDEAGVLRTWCEFPTDQAATDLARIFLGQFQADCGESACAVLDEIDEISDYSLSEGTFEVATTLAAWVGETCRVCEGEGEVANGDYYRPYSKCHRCDCQGRVNAIGPRAVLAAPIRELTLEDLAVEEIAIDSRVIVGMPGVTLPSEITDAIWGGKGQYYTAYPTREAARAAVGTAALNWARRQAGMQHDVEGRRFER